MLPISNSAKEAAPTCVEDVVVEEAQVLMQNLKAAENGNEVPPTTKIGLH